MISKNLKLASKHEKKPSVETMPVKKGPIKTEGEKHPKETGLKETEEGRRIPREVKSLADRLRARDANIDDEKAYRIAWSIYKKNTAEGRKYKTLEKAGALTFSDGLRVAMLSY